MLGERQGDALLLCCAASLGDGVVARLELFLEYILEQAATVVPNSVVLWVLLEEGGDLLEGGVCEVAGLDLVSGVLASYLANKWDIAHKTWSNGPRQTNLVANFLLQRPILLDMLALLLPRGLALVERRRRDAGNSVLVRANCQSTSLPRIQEPLSRTYACHRLTMYLFDSRRRFVQGLAVVDTAWSRKWKSE